MRQRELFKDHSAEKNDYVVSDFSANHFFEDKERKKIETKYNEILEVTSKFNRQSVSYQLSKKAALHSWLRYKEGFSADLVNIFLDEGNIKPGDTIMDPFMGSGTTALICQMRGVNSIGYDVMPISKVAITAKAAVMEYDIQEIERLVKEISLLKMPEDYNRTTPYVPITNTAYPDFNEKFIQFVSEYISGGKFSDSAKNLFTLCMINCLEQCSYTTKKGQYLGWDSRSKKVQMANKEREKKGKKLLPTHYCRETIDNIQSAVCAELKRVIADIKLIQSQKTKNIQDPAISFKQNSVLFELPLVDDDSINGVITSPPYCNRYDYTRTYALELVYLGLDDNKLKETRQSLLSCTVENRPKIAALRDFYAQHNKEDRFKYIMETIRSNKALTEVISSLLARKGNGDLNNNGVIKMVEGYFTELGFVFAELFRVCKKGSRVVFVNDNVRYGGEIIPVDFLSTSIAEDFGFKPIKVYCLQQQKGNSSQQMKKYGRAALRKSITVWKKPI